jgi:hypothetical protein
MQQQQYTIIPNEPQQNIVAATMMITTIQGNCTEYGAVTWVSTLEVLPPLPKVIDMSYFASLSYRYKAPRRESKSSMDRTESHDMTSDRSLIEIDQCCNFGTISIGPEGNQQVVEHHRMSEVAARSTGGLEGRVVHPAEGGVAGGRGGLAVVHKTGSIGCSTSYKQRCSKAEVKMTIHICELISIEGHDLRNPSAPTASTLS